MQIVDKDNFNSEVLESEGYVLVDYFGDGCVPCQELLPDIEALSEKYTQIKFVKMNTTKARRLAISQKIMGLPTITLYKNGEKVSELTKDDANKASIEDMLKKVL